jgi:hypothetical protein
MIIRPSNIDRRISCPGSGHMEEKCPQGPEGEYALEGKLMDEYFSHKDRDFSHLPLEQRELIQSANYWQAAIITATEEEYKLGGVEWEEAYQVPLPSLRSGGVVVCQGGTCDYRRIWHSPEGPISLIIDLKSGFLLVPPAELNYQLAAYARQNYSLTRSVCTIVGIVQPRAFSYDEKKSVAAYRDDKMRGIDEVLIEAHRKCLPPDAPLIPSEGACRYCTGMSTLQCPAYLGKVKQLHALQPNPKAIIAAMPDSELSLLGECVKLASSENFGNAVLSEIRCRIEAREFPGWSLESTGSVSKIIDTAKAFELLKTEHPTLTETEFIQCCNPGMEKLRELVRSLMPIPHGKKEVPKSHAKNETDRILEPVIVKTEKEKTVKFLK